MWIDSIDSPGIWRQHAHDAIRTINISYKRLCVPLHLDITRYNRILFKLHMNMYDHDLITLCGETCTNRQNVKIRFQTEVAAMRMMLAVWCLENRISNQFSVFIFSYIENGIRSIVWQRRSLTTKIVGMHDEDRKRKRKRSHAIYRPIAKYIRSVNALRISKCVCLYSQRWMKLRTCSKIEACKIKSANKSGEVL